MTAPTLCLGTIRAGTSQLTGTWNLVDLSYTHTDSGNVSSITDTLNSSQVECFDYDLHNRLVDAFTGDDCLGYDAGVGSGAYDQDFSYSAIHNITSFDGASYTYGTGNASGPGDAGPHAVTSIAAGAVTFGYDDNGNRITRTENSQTTSYSYGDDNRLDQVTLPDTSTVEFVYDADGNRVSRANGDDSTRYVGGLMEIDYDQTTVTETRTFYSFAGTSVAVRAHTAGTVAFSFGNHLGSPVAAFEDTTNTVSRMGYEPYGTERAVTGSLPSDHRFTNQIADNTTHPSGGTGLLFYNARYYDPAVGVFVAADALIPDPTLPVDFNRYAYVRDNPVNATDPSGHVVKPGVRLVGDEIAEPWYNGCGSRGRLIAGNQRGYGCVATGDPQRGGTLGDVVKLGFGLTAEIVHRGSAAAQKAVCLNARLAGPCLALLAVSTATGTVAAAVNDESVGKELANASKQAAEVGFWMVVADVIGPDATTTLMVGEFLENLFGTDSAWPQEPGTNGGGALPAVSPLGVVVAATDIVFGRGVALFVASFIGMVCSNAVSCE